MTNAGTVQPLSEKRGAPLRLLKAGLLLALLMAIGALAWYLAITGIVGKKD